LIDWLARHHNYLITFFGENRKKIFFSNETIKRTWMPPGRVIWAVNGDDRSNGPTGSEAHETLNERKNRRLWVTISRMRRHAPCKPTDLNTCMWGGVPDVINRAIFFENRRKGFRWHFPLTLLVVLTTLSRYYRVSEWYRANKRFGTHARTDWRTHGRTTRKHNASAASIGVRTRWQVWIKFRDFTASRFFLHRIDYKQFHKKR